LDLDLERDVRFRPAKIREFGEGGLRHLPDRNRSCGTRPASGLSFPGVTFKNRKREGASVADVDLHRKWADAG